MFKMNVFHYDVLDIRANLNGDIPFWTSNCIHFSISNLKIHILQACTLAR